MAAPQHGSFLIWQAWDARDEIVAKPPSDRPSNAIGGYSIHTAVATPYIMSATAAKPKQSPATIGHGVGADAIG